jgi:methyl-accepting chemotaxis protein
VRIANLRVGARLALAFGLLIALLLVVAAVGLTRLAALNAEFTEIVVDRHSRTGLLGDIAGEVNQISQSVHRALIVNNAEEARKEVEKIDAAKQKVSGMLEQLDKAFGQEGEQAKALQQEAHNRNSAYMVSLVKFTRLLGAGRTDDARTLLNSQLNVELDASLRAIQALSRLQTSLMERGVEEAAASYRGARNFVVLLTLVAMLLAILIGMWIARGIAQPLREAVSVAGRVAAGNLASRIEVHGTDETAQLMDALKQMNSSLQRIVGEVRGGSDAIASASVQLVKANNDLSHRTEEQASSLEETASSMEEFTASVTQNADHARQANTLAESTSQMAAKGETVVNDVVETMGSISASSKKIVEIIAVIDGIAFQTNILALNAAVEAARAGAQGQGFAVVAAEVRNLALRSAAAAKEIKTLIESSVAQVNRGNMLVDQAGRTMAEVLSGTREVSRIIGDIALASQEQRSGIGQVNQALLQMEKTTQQNAAQVEQVSAAMEMLEAQARNLVEAVRVFKLDEAAGRATYPKALPAGRTRGAEGSSKTTPTLPRTELTR